MFISKSQCMYGLLMFAPIQVCVYVIDHFRPPVEPPVIPCDACRIVTASRMALPVHLDSGGLLI